MTQGVPWLGEKEQHTLAAVSSGDVLSGDASEVMVGWVDVSAKVGSVRVCDAREENVWCNSQLCFVSQGPSRG